MNETNEYYIDLISRYFTGETSPEEMGSLASWVKENDENRKVFDDYRKAWEMTEQSFLESRINLEDEWSLMKNRLSPGIQPTERKVVPLRNEEMEKTRNHWWKLAAAILVLITASTLIYYFFKGSNTVEVFADNGIKEIVLPDGSTITLNQGAMIEYPVRFEKTRKVRLSGEAYFNVKHDASSPFIVTGNKASVEVLGTMFNVNTRDVDGNMTVVLTSGKVSLYYGRKSTHQVILLPGEQARLSASTQTIEKVISPDVNYMAWKTRRIVFDNMPLSTIVRTLNSVYHTDIRLSDPGLGRCRITATFDQQPVTAVLNVLKNTLDIQVIKTGDQYLLSGRSCD